MARRNRNNQGHEQRIPNRQPARGKRGKQAQQMEHKVREISTEEEAKLELEANKPKFGKLVPMTTKQKTLIQMLEHKRVVFIHGPAGTSKTFVPTSLAVEALEAGTIDRLVIARPQVGCGEEMGFRPGTEAEKFEGWIRPFMEIIEGKLGMSRAATYLKYGKIVAAPLETMRGSTFRNAYIILDEAQNTTPEQMKMFLTRLGQASQMVINGDIEQSDLPINQMSGLEDALDVFGHDSDFGVMEFSEDDIVRDPFVKKMIIAYRRRHQRRRAMAQQAA